jgi:hypothetical protein
MGELLRTFYLILAWALIMKMQLNLEIDQTSTRVLKEGLEIAVHDAALALDETELAQGHIVFDQTRALDNLKRSLEANLSVTSTDGRTYQPASHSFFQSPITIVHVEFIDEQTPDPASPTGKVQFPYIYDNPDYEIVDVLNGPSVIVLAKTMSPRYFSDVPMEIRRAAVYEYVSP